MTGLLGGQTSQLGAFVLGAGDTATASTTLTAYPFHVTVAESRRVTVAEPRSVALP